MRHLRTALDVAPPVRRARRPGAEHSAHHQVLHVGKEDGRPIGGGVCQRRQVAHQLEADLRHGSFGALASDQRLAHGGVVELADWRLLLLLLMGDGRSAGRRGGGAGWGR